MVFKSRYLARVFCQNNGLDPDDYCIVRTSDKCIAGFEVFIRSSSAIIDTYITEKKFNKEVQDRERIRHRSERKVLHD